MAKIKLQGEFKGYFTGKSIIEVPIDTFVHLNNCYVELGQLVKRRAISFLDVAGSAFAPANFYEMKHLTPGDPDTNARDLIYKHSSTDAYRRVRVGGASFALSASTFSAGTQWSPERMDFAESGNVLYVADGTPKCKRFEPGTDYLFNIGLPIPAQPGGGPTIGGASWPATASTSAHKVTWVRSNATIVLESLASSSRVLAVNANLTTINTINRPAVPDNDYGATHWNVYRRMNEIGIFFRLTTIPIATTQFNDTFISASIQFPEPVRNHELDTEIYRVAEYKGRMWGAEEEGNNLRFSELYFPDYWPPSNVFEIGDRNERFTRLIAFEEFLLVVKKYSMHSIVGNNIIDFRQQRVNTEGSLSPWSTFRFRNSLFYVNKSGIYWWKFGEEPVNIGLQIWTEIENLNLDDWIAGIEPTKNYIWFAQDNTTAVYVFNPDIGRFVGKFTTPDVLRSVSIVGRHNDKHRLGLQISLGMRSYDEAQDTTATPETTMSIAAFLGTNLAARMEDDAPREKMYESIRIHDGRPSSTVETVTLVSNTEAESDSPTTATQFPRVSGTVSMNTASVKNIKRIGRGVQDLSIGIMKVGSDINVPWSWVGLELNINEIGMW